MNKLLCAAIIGALLEGVVMMPRGGLLTIGLAPVGSSLCTLLYAAVCAWLPKDDGTISVISKQARPSRQAPV